MNQGCELGDALVVEGGRHDTALVSPKLALAGQQGSSRGAARLIAEHGDPAVQLGHEDNDRLESDTACRTDLCEDLVTLLAGGDLPSEPILMV